MTEGIINCREVLKRAVITAGSVSGITGTASAIELSQMEQDISESDIKSNCGKCNIYKLDAYSSKK